MKKTAERPSSGRVALAFTAAAAVPILLGMCGFGLVELFSGRGPAAALAFAGLAGVFGVLLGLPTRLLAVPLYLILRNSVRLTAAIAMACWALIGSGSGILLALPANGQTSRLTMDDLYLVALFAGLGLVGGLTFWRVHEGGRRRATPHPSGSA